MEEGKGIRLQADFPQQLERRRESVVGEGGAGKEKGSTRWIDPFLFGSACWARTSDPLINSQLLYQLS